MSQVVEAGAANSREAAQGTGQITGFGEQQIQDMTLLLTSPVITFIKVTMVILIALPIFRGIYYRSGKVLNAFRTGKH